MINNFSPIREINQRDKYFFKKMISNLPDLVFQLSYSSSGILTFPFFNKAVINYFELTKEQALGMLTDGYIEEVKEVKETKSKK